MENIVEGEMNVRSGRWPTICRCSSRISLPQRELAIGDDEEEKYINDKSDNLFLRNKEAFKTEKDTSITLKCPQ